MPPAPPAAPSAPSAPVPQTVSSERPSTVVQEAPLFVRYLAAGLGSLVTDFSVFTLLTGVAGLDPLIAHLVSRPLGGLACFFLNRSWTFRSSGRVGGQLLRFACVFGVSLLLTEALLALFCRGFELAPLPGKALAEALVVLFNFIALKHWTFRWRREP